MCIYISTPGRLEQKDKNDRRFIKCDVSRKMKGVAFGCLKKGKNGKVMRKIMANCSLCP